MQGRRFPSFVDDLPLTRRALVFATERHRGQRRVADGAPFILHPLEVAQLLHISGHPDPVVAAGVLHDVLESTPVAASELEAQFGPQVAGLVVAVSEPSAGGDFRARKRALRDAVSDAPTDALVVYAADKVARVRELRMWLVADPADARPAGAELLAHYWSSLALLERRIPGDALVRRLRFELEALRLLPPRIA